MSAAVITTHKLSSLISGLVASEQMITDTLISGLTLDSRQVQKSWMYLSLAQNAELRTTYLKQALELGATVILFDDVTGLTAEQVELIEAAGAESYAMAQLAQQASEIAARYYGNPSTTMTVIAVTGTNGKTSVSQFIAQALDYLGIECGVIGTLGVGKIGDLSSTGMTTPDPILMQAVLADFYQQGLRHVVLEASSHALEQGRLNKVAIDVAILTNLSRDHLDYHTTMEDYALAKQKLFEFAGLKVAIVNQADTFGQTLIKLLSANQSIELLTYTTHTADNDASFEAHTIESYLSGLAFTVASQESTAQITSQLLGRFNVDNLLAALAAIVAVGIEFDTACEAIAHCHAVDGRMQTYSADNKAEVVIDFAHTPDALSQALQSLRTHLPEQGELWCVFGCGGDRDKGKRSVMGQCAEHYADKVVLTADNPRSEDNQDIVRDILTGIKNSQQVHIEHDRQRAISYAVDHAAQNDIVLVAGKGHEDYQEILGQKIPFSDAKAVATALHAANDDKHSFAEVQ